MVLGHGPGSQQLSQLPFCPEMHRSWGQGYGAGRSFSDSAEVLLLPAQFGGSADVPQVKQTSLCTSPALMQGGFSAPAVAALFAFPPMASHGASSPSLQPAEVDLLLPCFPCVPLCAVSLSWGIRSGHISPPDGPMWLCLLCCPGQGLDFPLCVVAVGFTSLSSGGFPYGWAAFVEHLGVLFCNKLCCPSLALLPFSQWVFWLPGTVSKSLGSRLRTSHVYGEGKGVMRRNRAFWGLRESRK